ncbi:MAG TPA: RagB/SusD family nutrient uptake outer membrane protein [Chitinophagaceae bacterium]|nr:RagB/SusD family nutrient uptake outer membrane protein [Chitinophagaceae bacterium]
MKKIFNHYLLAILSIGVLLTACKKNFLDTKPIGVYSDADIWNDLTLAQTFLNNSYSQLPSGFERGSQGWDHSIETLDEVSDDSYDQYSWTVYMPVINGTFTAASSPLNWQWNHNYTAIRSVNTFLSHIDNVPGDAAIKKRLKGEAQFIRAVFYEELAKYFGGVPLITAPQSLKDDIYVKRNTVQEVLNFLIQQTDSAAAALPISYTAAGDYGRATKGAALALKSRILLTNGKWADAVTAAKAVMALNVYDLAPDYSALFISGNAKEIIFAKRYKQLQSYNGSDYNDFNDKNQPYFVGGWGSMNPTQNLVDEYEMTDGKLPANSPLYTDAQPYANRDSRFYASITYQGSKWKNQTIDFNSGAEYSATGYYLRKFLNENQVLYNGGATLDWPSIRYAEVLLNYAEAQNELVGPDQSVHDAINKVRTRARQPDVPLILTQAEMRDKIRHERRIELAFEEFRYNDLIRWGIGAQVLNAPIWGGKISNGLLTKFKVTDRVFVAPKNNVFPIPQSEIDKNKNLTQSTGW